MNDHTLNGQWRELTGKARQEWGRTTDDDWLQIQGRPERLAEPHRVTAREHAAAAL